MTYERKTNRIARKWHTVVTIAPFVDYTPDQCIAIRMKAGLTQGEMSSVLGVSPATILNIETGKTLMIKYIGPGELNEDGTRELQFELNGARRDVAVADHSASVTVHQVPMADPENKAQVGASIPGGVAKILVKPGDVVQANQVLMMIEAMKMETSVVSHIAGTIDQVLVSEGQSVKAGELLVTMR